MHSVGTMPGCEFDWGRLSHDRSVNGGQKGPVRSNAGLEAGDCAPLWDGESAHCCERLAKPDI